MTKLPAACPAMTGTILSAMPGHCWKCKRAGVRRPIGLCNDCLEELVEWDRAHR